ncbi:GNAT family N-acetyltransferase [Sphingomonas canadensis]|uniref:GNAT family N-acetyltransferase n=1 Tax=Sphingomonas canadensis TaxID=1219257 RepID=A0ABW3H4G1_9SPHN|nr:GNAT family N-acetyltransferase [Sphingomonas canadensis]MCW3834865.1 GNAT family N-acetyltransferase [Sphingomonas canadensis]
MNVRISFDPAERQLDVIHGFLASSYWSPGIPRETVARALEHSIAASAFDGDAQIGLARVVTDRATMAYLADVFVLEAWRGRGVARAMIEALHAHPELQGLRRWLLFTRDMHTVYERLGWERAPHPERLMLRDNPGVYA